MKHLFKRAQFIKTVQQLCRLALLVVPVGVLAGSASAFFLWLLHLATDFRFEHGWLLFLLPVAGLGLGLLYHWVGKPAEGGNNLILEQIHVSGGGVPKRMAPLILFSTVITHLFGGSAGREGTAIQMGGSIASGYAGWFGFEGKDRQILLMAGMAAGFGSVFGTPFAGAIFAIEVLVIGRIQYKALIPMLVASVIGDVTCSAWGVKHTIYQVADVLPGNGVFDLSLLGKAAIAGVAFGLTGRLFSEMIHTLQGTLRRIIPWAPGRPVIGGIVIIALVYLLGTRDFLGLGVESPDPNGVTILSAFLPGGAQTWSWWWKIVFTTVTLASGFKGGEVTPLFFIGATLGNTLAGPLGVPVDLFAGLGFLAVFASSANTPLACTIMGMELFGAHNAAYFAVACFVAYFFSGHCGIYLSQRIGIPKHPLIPANISLREARELSHGVSIGVLKSLRDKFLR